MSRNVKDFDSIELPQISPQQQQVIELLLSGTSQAQSAKQAGVTPETVSRWMNLNADFISIYNERKLAAWQHSQQGLFLLRDKAIATLRELLESSDDRLRLESAKFVLNSAEKPAEQLNPEKIKLDISQAHEVSHFDDLRAKLYAQRSKEK